MGPHRQDSPRASGTRGQRGTERPFLLARCWDHNAQDLHLSRPQGLGAVTLHARLVREDRSDNEWTPGPPLSSAQRRDPATRRGGIREARADPGRPLLPVQHGRALPSPTVSRAALPARPPSASQETGAQRLLSSQQEAPVCLAPVAPYPVAPSAGSVLFRPGC